jgi:hypothetical protein
MAPDLQRNNKDVLEIRPFHLYTLQLFLDPGPGLFYKTDRTYGEKWTQEVLKKVSEAKHNPSTVVRLVRNIDFMCKICPYKAVGIPCNADLHDFDIRTIERLGIKYGDEYSIEDIKKMDVSNF